MKLLRPSEAQQEALLDFLEENPGIAKGILRTKMAKEDNKKKWSRVAIVLNALGEAKKDGRSWSKYWADKKCSLKKFCMQNNIINQDSEAAANLPPISRRMIAVMGTETSAICKTPSPLLTECSDPQSSSDVEEKPDVFTDLQNVIHIVAENTTPPTAPEPPPNPTRRRSPSPLHTQLNIEVDRLEKIEEKRVEAELMTARALADVASALNRCASSIKEGAELIANALLAKR